MNAEKKRGRALIALGALLLAGAIGLAGYNVWDGMRAGREAGQVLEELVARMEETRAADGHAAAVSAPGGYPGVFAETAMATEEIDGYAYIGVVEIPRLGISLPVMDTWDYTRLRVSPCRYEGSVYSDDLVIAAHNYPEHFSPIKWIRPETEVYFTTVDGNVFQYVVDSVETLRPEQVEDLVSGDDWDLTLFTCNTGGGTRCAVRCVRVSPGR